MSSVKLVPPLVEYATPSRFVAAVKNGSVCWESLNPTATFVPATAIDVSLCVV